MASIGIQEEDRHSLAEIVTGLEHDETQSNSTAETVTGREHDETQSHDSQASAKRLPVRTKGHSFTLL